MNRLKRKYLSKIEEIPESQLDNADDLQGVVPIVMIMMGGLCLSLLILLFENIYFCLTNKREETLPYSGKFFNKMKPNIVKFTFIKK